MSLPHYYPVATRRTRSQSKVDSKNETVEACAFTTSTQIPSQVRNQLADLSLSPVNIVVDSPSSAASPSHNTSNNNGLDLVKEPSHSQSKHESHVDECDLENWGLYPEVLRWYQARKIARMFDWQKDCLKSEGVLAGRSLVFSAPTSAGKTMVADILMIKQAFENRKKVLVILPFISIIREKMLTLQSMLKSTHLKVGGFMGQHHTPGGFEKVNIAICTVEKANNYVLKLLREGRLDEIGAIIVDEVHTISDGRRGVTLELLLSKIMMHKKKYHTKIQIIAMSATLPNVPSLANWLDAAVYQTDFRPVELRETIKLDRKVHDAREMKVLYEISEKQCPDIKSDSIYLTVKSVIEKRSVLIFYNNKEKCEKLAFAISSRIKTVGLQSGPAGERVRSFVKQEDVTMVLNQLDSCIIKSDETVKQCVKFGVAFHHGGLCMEHRAIIEEAFRAGRLKVLVATSTLSSGVNLPARIVLIQSPLFGNKMMDPLTYRQMIGRAGRKGIDEQGESILLCSSQDEIQLGKQLVTCETPPVRSSISDVSSSSAKGALQKAILEAISIELANNEQDILAYMNSTFYFSSADEETRELYQKEVKTALRYLLDRHFICKKHHQTASEGDAEVPCDYEISQLGSACIAASIYPQEALRLLENLSNSAYGLVVRSDIHLLFLIIPDNMATSTAFSTDLLRKVIEGWHRNETTTIYSKIAEVLKINYMKIMGSASDKVTDARLTKFFFAIILQEIIKEVPLHDLEPKYGVSKATLQSLQNNSAAFASMASSFCRELGWESFQLLIENLQTRLEFGVKRELVNLMRLPCLNAKLARLLYKANLDTIVQVANASQQQILKAISVGQVFVSSPDKCKEPRNTVWIESRKESLALPEVAALIQLEAREITKEESAVTWLKEQLEEPEQSEQPKQPKTPEVFKTPNKRPRSKSKSTRSRSKSTSASARLSDRLLRASIAIANQVPSTSTGNLAVASTSNPPSQVTHESFSTPKKKQKTKPLNFLSPDEKTKPIKCVDEASLVDVIHLWSEFKRMSIHFSLKSVTSYTCAIGQKMGAPAPSAAKTDETLVDNMFVEAIFLSFGGSNVYVISEKNTIQLLSQVMERFLEKNDRSDLELVVDRVLRVYKIMRVVLGLPRSLLKKFLWFDIRIACWFDDTEAPQPSLPQSYIERYLSTFVKCHDAMKKRGKSSLEYCAFTASIMLHIASKLQSDVLSQGQMMKSFREIEMKSALVLAECALQGFIVDKVYLQELTSRLASLEAQLTERAETLAAEPFNLQSPEQVAQILYFKLNLVSVACEVIDTNPYRINKIKASNKLPDHLKTRREVLEKLAKYHELPKIIQEHRSVVNVMTSTIKPVLDNLQRKGAYDTIMPKFELFTATGRVTMGEPDLMKTPRTFTVGKEMVNVRKLFIARPGFTLISADYSQLEMRVLAHVSQDVQLTDALNSGSDVFRELAARIDSCFVDDVDDERRQQAKGISYGIIYGMGLRQLSSRLGVSEEEASDIKETFLKTLSGINPFIEKTMKKLRENLYVETIGGRRRILPAIASSDGDDRSKAKRQAINSTIQGSAADIAKAAMSKVDEAIDKANIEAFLTLEMHDELIYQVKCESLYTFAKLLSQSMQQVTHDLFPDFQVQLTVNLKTGPNWGEMSALDADALTPPASR